MYIIGLTAIVSCSFARIYARLITCNALFLKTLSLPFRGLKEVFYYASDCRIPTRVLKEVFHRPHNMDIISLTVLASFSFVRISRLNLRLRFLLEEYNFFLKIWKYSTIMYKLSFAKRKDEPENNKNRTSRRLDANNIFVRSYVRHKKVA